MPITLNGTTGITNDGGYTGDGVSFADTTPANTLVTDTSGNVGLGTSSPAYKLDVQNGTGRIYNATFPSLRIQNSDTGTGSSDGLLVEMSGTNALFVNYESSNMIFSTANTERMRITSGGALLIGTTDSGFNSKVVVKSPASWTSNNYRSDSATATGTSWNHFYGTSNSNSVANIIIYGNGNIQNANNSYGSISDIKLKENIVDATPKLAKLMQIKVRNYNLKGDYEQHKQIGVIAQELETVFPSLVEETIDKDAEGNDAGTTTKSVKYSVFVPMLIKAMQELKATVDAQATRIAALESAGA
jgi:hypothetical protein